MSCLGRYGGFRPCFVSVCGQGAIRRGLRGHIRLDESVVRCSRSEFLVY